MYMMNQQLQQTYQAAADYLAAHDKKLAAIIKRTSLYDIVPHHNYYEALVRSIISQQLSVKAAATIRERFIELCGGKIAEPNDILALDIDDMRRVGLSKQKANYIRDLAGHVVADKISFDTLDVLSNEEVVRELTDVKGIGEWTVHMFLIFCMGRLDVLAAGDLGIRNGVRKVYGLDYTPSPAEVAAIAEANHWHPYESVACWYMWRVLDNEPTV